MHKDNNQHIYKATGIFLSKNEDNVKYALYYPIII